MIPKIIHFCWISGDPYPTKIQKCINSWINKENGVLSDYQVVKWDYQKTMSIGNKWIKQAIEEKKYAFAADCVRFYALYHYGGIYLDSDVEVVKSFNDLLSLPYFIGAENNAHLFEAAIIGAEPGLAWIHECLNYYNGRSFINIFGEYRQAVLPYIMEQQLRKKYQLKEINSIHDFDLSDNVVCYLPCQYFCPKNWSTQEIHISPETYCIHHFESEWKKTIGYSNNIGIHTKLLRKIKIVASFIKHKILHI